MTEQPGSQPTPREPDIEEWREALRQARHMVSALCKSRGTTGSREWIMSIPARPDYDPDLVIGAGLRAGVFALNFIEDHLRTVSAAERAELLEVLEDVVNQACLVDDGTLDSMALSANADALLLLARLGRVETISVGGRRVIARWADTAEAAPEPTP